MPLVKAKEVKALTKWDKEDMRKARKYGWVKWRKDKKLGFVYELNSIDEKLIKTA